MATKFAKWISWVFDHPVDEPNPWYWNYSGPVIAPEGGQALQYLTTLVGDARQVLKPFSNAQCDQGLNFLLNRICCDHLGSYLFDTWVDESLPWADRKASINSVKTFFSEFYPSRCPEQFVPGPDGWKNADPLHRSCFMWWDLVGPNPAAREPVQQQVAEACLDVLAEILDIEFRPCWWSALHGLGHWGEYNREKSSGLIEAFIAKRKHQLGEKLQKYAETAKIGDLQ